MLIVFTTVRVCIYNICLNWLSNAKPIKRPTLSDVPHVQDGVPENPRRYLLHGSVLEVMQLQSLRKCKEHC